MQLTLEERVAVENGQPVRFVIPESSIECVVLRADHFEDCQADVSLDDCPIEDLMRLAAETFEDEDWEFPDDQGRPHERAKK